MYNDYTKSVNIAHDWIRWPCIRVSSAEVPSFLSENASLGTWCETWVFSDCPHINTTQRFFKTKGKALKAHYHIVTNIRGIINDLDNQETD